MKTLTYTVRFNTPAFLGNAEQNAEWRTPPFKALLRQWWRVLIAKEHRYNHAAIRQHEGDLFGNAWLSDSDGKPLHRKSRVAIRLGDWTGGTVTSQDWPGGAMESVTTTRDGKGRVRADVYLGFGPVLPEKRGERRPITIRGAIVSDRENTLCLLPERLEQLRPTDQDMKSVSDALQLMAWFGTIGSRSRNGWGSLSLEAKSDTKGLSSRPGAENELLRRIGREWTKCLELDWPHALGFSCGKPLMWISQPYPDWRKVMGCLANIRVEVRAVAKAYAGPERIGGIHLLGYPAGNHWELRQLKKGKPQRDDQEGRLATQLRFKVLRTSEGLTGMVFHMPHRFPDELMDRLTVEQKEWLRNNEQEAWTEIHKALDGSSRLTPLGETI